MTLLAGVVIGFAVVSFRQLRRLRKADQLIFAATREPLERNGELASYSSDDVCAFTKTEGQERVLVLANLRNAPVSYAVPVVVGRTGWRNAFDGPPAALELLTLLPYQYLILKK